MSGRTTINIAGFTVDDNVSLSDDLFNISAGATLALLSFDALNDDAVSGSGRVSIAGPTTLDDRLLLSGATLFANSSLLAQNGATVDLGQSSDDAVLARNIVRSAWTLDNGARITGAGSSEFVNFGLLDLTDSDSTVDANFYDRGGTIEVDDGTLDFASPGDVNRFVNDKIEGTGTFEVNDLGVLFGSSISTLDADLEGARIIGNVHVSSQNVYIGDVNLRVGSVLTLTNSAAGVNLVEIVGGGTIILRGDDSVGAQSSLVGAVTFENYGNTTFTNTNIEFDARSWADDTVTIENETGATWTDNGGFFSSSHFTSSGAGNAVFVNDGTFIEETQLGATFDMAVVNNGLMEAGTPSQLPNIAFQTTSFVLTSVTGTGTIDIGFDPVTVNSVGSGQTLNFDASLTGTQTPILDINDIAGFAGTVTGFDQGGVTNDQMVANTATWQFQDFVANSGGTGGALMFSNGSAETAINLTGSYNPLGFRSAVSGSTTTIAYAG